MARTNRAAAAASKPGKVEKVLQEKSSNVSRKAKKAQRTRLYKKTKRARQLEAIKTALQGADDPAKKKELAKLKGQIFKPKSRGSEQLQQLRLLVKKQQEEIEELKKTLQGASIPILEPPASPLVEEAGEEPDSSPVKIQQQLMLEVAQSSNAGDDDAEAPSPFLVVEEVVEQAAGDDLAEQMEGVETTTTMTETTTTITTNENGVGYPTLPTVEGDDAVEEVKETIEETNNSPERQETNVVESSQVKETSEEAMGSGQVTPKFSGTPLKPTEKFRDSSADSNAGTPKSVRRSPRKRTKRRSFAGHSYAV